MTGKRWGSPGLFGMLLVAGVVLARGAVEAQDLGAVAGEVTDATGAVLPGVTVEVTSPALIEGTRTAITDGSGRYSVVSLRPGVYAVTFTLSGFSVVRREGVQLSAGFTAPVNAQLRIGSLAETITVTGASPTVDVRNVRTQSVLDVDTTLNVLPSAQNVSAFATLTLGATLMGNAGTGGVDVGGSGGEMGTASIHNNREGDMKIAQDGMSSNNSMGTNGGILHMGQHYNMEAVSEVAMSSNGMMAETETAGLQINYVPKDGGNRFSASGRATYANDRFSADNITPELRAKGATNPPEVKRIWDWGGGMGGPIRRDVLWFFTAHRWWGAESYVPGSFWNGAQGQKSATGVPLYVADLNRRGFNADPSQENSVRLTWQVTSKDKIGFFGNRGDQCLCGRAISAILAPESGLRASAPSNHFFQGTWTRTQSSRLLFEAGQSRLRNPFEFQRAPGVSETDIQIVELSPLFIYNAWAADAIPYNVGDKSATDQLNGRASVSYVTGSHSFKAGAQWMHGWIESNGSNNAIPGFGPANVTTLGGVPIAITLVSHPQYNRSDFRNIGFYAQDQWSIQRLTVNLGIRFDVFDGWSPDQESPANSYVPAIRVSRVDGTPRWRDVSPRLGAAYDLAGDGRTAIKVTAGRYVQGMGTGLPLANNPANAISKSTTRTWNDANRNFFPEGDPRNPAANGELGPSANAAFGTPRITSFFDADMLTDNRPYTWQMSASVDRELADNMRLSIGYFRTMHFNQTVLDNESVIAADYDAFCVVAPSGIPGAGGQRVCGFADLSAAGRARVPRNTTKIDKNFGDRTEVYNGVDVDVNLRYGNGGLLRGGFSLGRTVNDSCFVVDSPQDLYQCRVVVPLAGNSQVKLSGSYPAPYGIELSAVYQNLPGPAIQATATFSSAQIAPSLGRNLSACPAATGACNATVNLNMLVPNAAFEGRIQQVDVRLAKLLNGPFGRVRVTFDLYNAFNASPILGRNNTFGTVGAGWGRPTAVMAGRLIKLGAQYSWN